MSVMSKTMRPSTLIAATSVLALTTSMAWAQGFSIAIDGQQVAGDAQVQDLARQADIDLSQADVKVQFDGLGAKPALDIKVIGDAGQIEAGQTVTVQSYLNYPNFVTRGDLRVMI